MTQSVRPGEVRTDAALRADATIAFVGTIHTPWRRREECPRQGDRGGPLCRIVLDPPWDAALAGIEGFERLEVLYWLHESRRDLVLQTPGQGNGPRGTFALRSPVRPNPIGTARVTLVERDGPVLVVRGLDCIDGTPLVDVKPDRCAHGGPGG